jgi:hypothetical protein
MRDTTIGSQVGADWRALDPLSLSVATAHSTKLRLHFRIAKARTPVDRKGPELLVFAKTKLVYRRSQTDRQKPAMVTPAMKGLLHDLK